MAAGHWIKLYRKIITSQVFARAELLKLFTLCLLKANFKDGWAQIEGITEPIQVKRGQFVTGRFALHVDFYQGKRRSSNKSPRTVWRWLETLAEIGVLSINATNKYSLITIVKYGTYQDAMEDSVQQIDQQQAFSDQQLGQHVTTCKKNKKYQKEENNNSSTGDVDEKDLNQEEVARVMRRIASVAPAKKDADREFVRKWACLCVSGRIPLDFVEGPIDGITHRAKGPPEKPIAFFISATQDKCKRSRPRKNWGHLLRCVRLRDDLQPAATPGANHFPVALTKAPHANSGAKTQADLLKEIAALPR